MKSSKKGIFVAGWHLNFLSIAACEKADITTVEMTNKDKIIKTFKHLKIT